MTPDNREEVAGGVLGKVAGRLKETAGEVLGRDDMDLALHAWKSGQLLTPGHFERQEEILLAHVNARRAIERALQRA